MRMKSVLALTALSAATFIAGVAYAAAADLKSSEQAAQNKSTAQTSAPIRDPQSTQPVSTSSSQTEEVKQESKSEVEQKTKRTAHHKKHHRRHHRRYHHHHYHHHAYPIVFRHHIPTANFLVGGSLGYALQKEQFITRFTTNVPGYIIPAFNYRDHNEHISNEGTIFGLLVGWQWRYCRWMFGAEANVDMGDYELDRPFVYTISDSNRPIAGTVVYDRGDIYSLTARAGYFVTPFFMPYLRAGVQFSRDEVQYQVNLFNNVLQTVSPNQQQIPIPDYSSRKKDIYGVVAGIGVEIPTYIGTSTIRFEYNFARTESLVIEDNMFPVVGNHKFRLPESHTGKIAFVWNFL